MIFAILHYNGPNPFIYSKGIAVEFGVMYGLTFKT